MNKNALILKYAEKMADQSLRSLIENGTLHPVDIFFAERYPNISDKSRLFLAFLLSKSREGHLCIAIDGDKMNPSLSPILDKILIAGADAIKGGISGEIINLNGKWYLKRYYECEDIFLKNLKRLIEAKPEIDFPKDALSAFLEARGLEVEQKNAILKTAHHSLSIICGGPGTGKTYTASIFIQSFLKFVSNKIAVAAPTGKAAANLRVALGELSAQCTIKTLHSLLRNRGQLPFDLILVDESSMVDAVLMAKLFAFVKEGARLVLLGDHYQLPPVESGNFFADIVQSCHENVTELKKCLRTDLQEIVDMAHRTKHGLKIPYFPLLPPKEFIEQMIAKFPLSEEWNEGLVERFQCFRVLTPLRRGPFGVDQLNQMLFQRHLEEAFRARLRKIGIPIIITRNDPSLDLYNGDTGYLLRENGKEAYAYFKEGKQIPIHSLPHYEYAYFLSIHKSQGSEYDEVCILLPDGAECFGREILYTAITRARKKVTVFASEPVLNEVLKRTTLRLSGMSR